jgi:hypothetical protein
MEGFMTKSNKHTCVLYDGSRGKFLHTYPRETVTTKRRPLNAPFRGAPDYMCNPYYWWFECLRRNAGYEKYCRTGKPKKYTELYEHWGNIHEEDDFLDWWDRHKSIFVEPPQRNIEVTDVAINDENTITLVVPLELDKTFLISRFKRRLATYKTEKYSQQSRAKYPLHTKAIIGSIAKHLMVYDKHKEQPKLSLWRLADECDLFVNHVVKPTPRVVFSKKGTTVEQYAEKVVRRRKTSLVERHLTIAKQYIANTGKGEFPKRERK